MGNTHGVSNAAKPLKNERKKIRSNDFLPAFPSLFSRTFNCSFVLFFSALIFSLDLFSVSDKPSLKDVGGTYSSL